MRVQRFYQIVAVVTVAALTSAQSGGPGPKKKVYRDTIYRWNTKPAPVKPVVTHTPPASPGILRDLKINAQIKRFSVSKSEQKMMVYFGDTFKVFRIALGANPKGHKTRKGDNKTPEGTYRITLKNPKSRGYLSLKISYPNETDRANSRRIGADPGGDIFIHGLWWPTQDPQTHWKDNWTRGCIAVNNSEIEEIYKYTNLDTEITILP